MSSYVTAELRRSVRSRAKSLCEYCLIHEGNAYLGCEVDHVLSEKHGGLTVAENLAFACQLCNRAKGSDVGTMLPGTGAFCRFFNPRVDRWADHFALVGAEIVATSEIGEATLRILRMNDPERVLERSVLAEKGLFPSPAAVEILTGGLRR